MADSETAYLSIPIVNQHLEMAAESLAKTTKASFVEYMRGTLDSRYGPQCESPLEAIFWVWWRALTEPASAYAYLWLCPQWEVTVSDVTFRLDFAVELTPEEDFEKDLREYGLAWKPIAIELDGHAFHEKTLAQVTYRNQRDRLLQQAGWTVFHFSWSEFTRRPEESVWEVVDLARRQYWALLGELAQRRVTAERAAVNQVGALTSQES